MNVLDTPIESLTISLKSSNYTSKLSESNFIFELNTPIISYPNVDMLIALDSFFFTNSFYTIGKYNDKLYYTLEGIDYIRSVAHSFFGLVDLISNLNVLFSGIFVFSYSVYTYKTTITSVGGKYFNINGGLYNINETLGFDKNGFSSSVNVITSPNLFNMMQVQMVNITVPNLNIKSLGVKNDNKFNLLGSLRVNVGPGEIMNYYNTNGFRFKISDTTITSLNIVLLDQSENPIEFNGVEWFMQISVCFQYKKAFILPNYLINDVNPDDTIDYYLEREQRRNKNKMLDEILLNKNI